jgi:hypothetical protein
MTTRSRTPDRSCGKPATNRLSYGAALAQTVSRRLPTAAAQIRAWVWICGGQSGARAGFLWVLGFPLPNSFHQLLHNYHHLSSEAGTIG